MSTPQTLFRTGGFGLKSAAPSGRLINELLRWADVQEDLGDGRTRLRLSKKRLKDREVRAALGADAARAADVAVVFDDREGEIVQVAAVAPEPLDGDSWSQEAERAYEAYVAAFRRPRRSPPARIAA